jgi:hypothetical protein
MITIQYAYHSLNGEAIYGVSTNFTLFVSNDFDFHRCGETPIFNIDEWQEGWYMEMETDIASLTSDWYDKSGSGSGYSLPGEKSVPLPWPFGYPVQLTFSRTKRPDDMDMTKMFSPSCLPFVENGPNPCHDIRHYPVDIPPLTTKYSPKESRILEDHNFIVDYDLVYEKFSWFRSPPERLNWTFVSQYLDRLISAPHVMDLPLYPFTCSNDTECPGWTTKCDDSRTHDVQDCKLNEDGTPYFDYRILEPQDTSGHTFRIMDQLFDRFWDLNRRKDNVTLIDAMKFLVKWTLFP